ncbi:hypothetical protein FDECE_382 [Fusarium decemcellulare]|nr:hypothetical protein FDECE_382 [Fusarium decemcellulare]
MAEKDTKFSTSISALGEAKTSYEKVQNDKDLRTTFHEAGEGLATAFRVLTIVKKDHEEHDLIEDSKIMASLNTSSTSSKNMFKLVAETPQGSRFQEYQRAVREDGNGMKVEDLVVAVAKSVCDLAKNDATNPDMENDIKSLSAVIARLSKMEPSVPEDRFDGDTYNNFGSGDMLNAHHGSVNKSSGSGNHFPGATFSGSVSFGSMHT